MVDADGLADFLNSFPDDIITINYCLSATRPLSTGTVTYLAKRHADEGQESLFAALGLKDWETLDKYPHVIGNLADAIVTDFKHILGRVSSHAKTVEERVETYLKVENCRFPATAEFGPADPNPLFGDILNRPLSTEEFELLAKYVRSTQPHKLP